jgi:uncharacterized membrane protein
MSAIALRKYAVGASFIALVILVMMFDLSIAFPKG